MNKKILNISRILIIILLVCFIFGCAEKKPAELEKVTFRMNWIPYAEHAPVWVAKEKGFYAEEGLDVEVIYGKGSTLSATLVGTGENDFGMCSGDTALMSRTKEVPLKVLAVMVQTSPTAAISLKEKGITKPKDLEGKKVSVNVQSTKYQQFKAFSKINNLDSTKITEVPIEAASEIPALLEGKVDVLLDYVYESDAELAAKGHEINKILFEDYGVHIYSSALITNENLLNEKPELIKKFVKATMKGWDYAIKHPEEAIDIFSKNHPELNKENELTKFYGLTPMVETEFTKKQGLGYQSEEKWISTQELLFDLGIITEKININELYTNEFLN